MYILIVYNYGMNNKNATAENFVWDVYVRPSADSKPTVVCKIVAPSAAKARQFFVAQCPNEPNFFVSRQKKNATTILSKWKNAIRPVGGVEVDEPPADIIEEEKTAPEPSPFTAKQVEELRQIILSEITSNLTVSAESARRGWYGERWVTLTVEYGNKVISTTDIDISNDN